MAKKAIEAVGAIGPYSAAVRAGNLLFVSGQIPVNPAKDGILEEGIEGQAWQSLKNLQTVLQKGGFDLSDVVKTTVFLTDLNDFSVVNQVYSEFFESPYPARSCVEVKRLPKGALVEIEAIAAV